MKNRCWIACVAGLGGVMALAGGCALPSWAGGEKPKAEWKLEGKGTPGTLTPGAGSEGVADPVAANPYAVRIDVWAIAVPRRTVSANEAFWKRVDENAVDPGRYELLFVNGFRVGVARQDDWDYFKDLLSQNPARHQLNAVTLTDEQSVEVPVRKEVEGQTLSYFEAGKPVEMRSWGRCSNVMQLTFVPAPRRTDAARVAMTPVVRATKERLEVTANNEEQVLRYAVRERLYDLNLAVNVPFGQFLVVSPSTDTARATSIGRNFLMLDGEAEQSELVLLIVPSKVDVKEGKPLPGSPVLPGGGKGVAARVQ